MVELSEENLKEEVLKLNKIFNMNHLVVSELIDNRLLCEEFDVLEQIENLSFTAAVLHLKIINL